MQGEVGKGCTLHVVALLGRFGCLLNRVKTQDIYVGVLLCLLFVPCYGLLFRDYSDTLGAVQLGVANL